MNHLDPKSLISRLVILFFAIGIHEYAHCKFAELAGDPTPSYYGRVTLNLFKHFEPAGTIMMVMSSLLGVGIGWGRPAPMDPRKMKNPRWDFFIAVLAGPLSNLAQAILFGCLFRVVISKHEMSFDGPSPVLTFLFLAVSTNVSLMLFNLIPFGPLDGHWLFGLLMPEAPRYNWFKFNERIGFTGLFAIVLLLQVTNLGSYILVPIYKITGLIIGQPLE